MRSKIFIATGGGLGDFLADYFRDNHLWGYLESIKGVHPLTTIKVMASTHNTALQQLLEGHPHIDLFENCGWRVNGWDVWHKYKGEFTFIGNLDLSRYEYKRPALHMREENQHAEPIINAGRYIVLHPFGLRSCMPIEEWAYLADQLIGLGYNVIVIGGNHVRLANLGGDNIVDGGLAIKEEWTYERHGLINLVNNSHIRVALKLLIHADGFIGHCSCFNMMAWLHGCKSVVFSPPTERQLLQTLRRYAWPLIDNLPWCRNYYSDEWKSPRDAIDQAVNFFR